MKSKLTFLTGLIWTIALLHSGNVHAALPGDTLRTDTGEIIIVPDYGTPGVDYVDSQFIVSLLPGYLTLPPSQSEAYLDTCTVEDSLRSILEDHQVYYVKQVYTGAQLGDTLRLIDSSTVVIPDLSQIFELFQLVGGDVPSVIEDIYEHQATRYAAPNFFLTEAAEPNDPYWNDQDTPQWNLKNPGPFDNPPTYGIGCPIAWDVTAGADTVKVGIVDSGVEGNHIDLGGPEFPNYSKLVGGWNYADWNNSIGDAFDDDEHGHGTGTAGIAGALTNNIFGGGYFGMAGIAGGWNNLEFPAGAKLYSLKVKHDGGGYSNDAAFRAIVFGSDREFTETSFGCHILNCSLPGQGTSEEWEDAVIFAYKVGAVVTAARGNSGGPNSIYFPACVNHRNWVTSVGSYGKDGRICDIDFDNCHIPGTEYGYGSSYSNGMDLLAPGIDIPFTSKNGSINPEGGGTSYATPHVSGAVALLKSSDWGLSFNLTNEDYEWILKFSAYDPTSGETNAESDGDEWTLSDRYGHGQLRISAPIERLTDPAWTLTEHTASGMSKSQIGSQGTYKFRNPTGQPGNLFRLEGEYTVVRYEVFLNVNYSTLYADTPYVWGIGERPSGGNTIGWSAASPNYQVGWCRVVPKSQSKSGCTLQTNVYKVLIPLIGWKWYPCKPEEVLFQYRVWGIPLGPQFKADGELIPGEISLSGNYPNPFNSSTLIKFSIPEKSHVLLSVFDIMGRKVNTLIDKEIAAGEYSILWDGTDSDGLTVSSGIYYSRLVVADQIRTAKMTMLK